MSKFVPKIGLWYQELGSEMLFEIVAIDSEEGTVQVQYVDGEIADFDLDHWGELLLLPAAAPEDWRTPYEVDDDGDPDAAMHPPNWNSPVSGIEPDTMVGVDDYF